MSVIPSLGYTLDSSPPDIGVVFDGPPTSPSDVDYWTDGVLAAHWTGFSDPHTGVAEYWWAIGTCAACTDLQEFISVGLNQGKYKKYCVATACINIQLYQLLVAFGAYGACVKCVSI